MQIIALDLGIRGAAAGLFLMIMFVILIRRARSHDQAAWRGHGGPDRRLFDRHGTVRSEVDAVGTLPLMAGNSVVVWLWVRATFDDDFGVNAGMAPFG